MKDTYKEVKVFQYSNMKIRVHIPDLTPKERTRRMNAIHNQAEIFMKEVLHNE